MISGVYTITNTVTGDEYVGSGFLKRRASHHQRALLRGDHVNRHLQAAVDKYGIENFKFEVLYLCEPDECERYEQAYIDMLKPKYNIRLEASSNLGVKLSEETKAKMSAAQMGKKHSERAKAKLKVIANSPAGREQRRKNAAVLHEKYADEFPEWGRKGGRRGAAAMRANTTFEQRQEWARRGATATNTKKLPDGRSAAAVKGAAVLHAVKLPDGRSAVGVRGAAATNAKKLPDGRSLASVRGACSLHHKARPKNADELCAECAKP